MAAAKKWPPIDWLWHEYNRAHAWYSGEPEKLKAVSDKRTDRFWASNEDIKVHMPIAADISAMAASMIFADSPVFTSEDERVTERIDEIANHTLMYNVLLQAAEMSSVYGGVFLKWSWDKRDKAPILTAMPADAGVPYWSGNKIVKIELYSTVKIDENGKVWRLEETYTQDGHILSKLYCGDKIELGTEHALTAIEETKSVQPDANSGTDMMLAFYVPNMLPNRAYPHLRFGRSDYDGLYGLFDELDEVYSSIQRETRLTKTTVIVPAEYLQKRGNIFGDQSQYCKPDQWVYANNSGAFTALDIDTGHTSSPITTINPELRAESRIAVCNDLIRQILMQAGYAPQSAGIDVTGTSESGTALNMRERKSMRTSEVKKTYWWHALNDIIRAGLHLDVKVFNSGIDADVDISIEIPSNTQPDISQLAQIVEQLERAGAASIEYKVSLLHPDWTEEQRAEEVERIKAQNGAETQSDIDDMIRSIETENPAGEE